MASPSRTIELFVPASWRDPVAAVLRAEVPPRVAEHLQQLPGEDMFHDTMEYLTEAYSATGDSLSEDRLHDLRESIIAAFSFFRSYHGCRPLSLGPYLRDGLLPLTRERLAAIAFDLFEGTVSRAEIDELARRAKLSTREGHVYFTADKGELIQSCGHYLIYGPESLCCLWRDQNDRPTPRFLESQARHRERGFPTVFTCDVPLHLVTDSYRRELADTLITQFFQLVSRQPVAPREWSRNWGYSIRQPLAPEFLRAHEHPATIPDPLRYGTFRNRHTSCDWCKPRATEASA
ncbi:hypothetical protein OH491_26840 [Termitidicoccus mucosus]|uniref:Uncharacterized protein n=1 Tax=Termitidicoccus mucosus TaxID=1184151 RepID=A0A178IE48_9BACT|nr:hypothetical protein AW736_23925 [Opitutaceae bacterium TSB47]